MKLGVKNFIIFLLVIVTFGGCSASETKDQNTITVWHWLSDRDDAFQELAKRYEEKYKVKVKFDLYAPSEVYTQRVKAAAQTKTLPDIFGILGEKRDFASFIRSGHVADLTEALNVKEGDVAWKDELFAKALSVNEFPAGNAYDIAPGIYGVPLDVSTIQMVYNKKLFAKAGLDPNDPPDTWDEFVLACRALKKKGIPRFVSGFGEIWMIDALASNFAMNVMGQQKVFDTYAGKVPYTDPDWIKVLSLFKQMADESMLVEGAVTMVNKSAEQTFANERAAFAFNGSWCVNVYRGMNPGLEYGAILPPKVTKENPMFIWGGAGTSFMVNNHPIRREAAVRFLRWLTAPEQQAYLAEETHNLPSNKASLKQISPILSEFADDVEVTTHPNVYPVNEVPSVTEALDKGIQSILIGEKTPEAVAQEVQRVKAKEIKRSAG